MFRLLQWSDSHLSENNVTATQNLIPTVPDVDFCVHCGDITSVCFQNGIGSYNQNLSACVIGNHDSIDQSGVNDVAFRWDKQVSQTMLYNRYFVTSKHTFGLDMKANTTWWSKEFAYKKILMLGINDTTLGDAQSEQLAWFKTKIKYAEDNNLAIIVAKHGPTNYVNIEPGNFTGGWMLTSKFIAENNKYNTTFNGNDLMIRELVNTHAKVLCVICGHIHVDGFGYITKTDGTLIPMMFVGSTTFDVDNDVNRSTNTLLTNCALCNMIDYDENVDSLRFYRLGADAVSNGAARKMLVHSYKENRTVATCSVM